MKKMRYQGCGHRCYFDACRSIIVIPNGDTYPCASLSDPKFFIGNVNDDGFASHLDERLSNAKKMIGLPSRCLICADRDLCGGPCPAGTYSTAGNADVDCAVRKVFMRHAREK